MRFDWARIIDRAESLCRIVAPHETKGRPLYVLRQSKLKGAVRESVCGPAGFTSPGLSLLARKALGKRFKGPGVAMVLCDRVLESQIQEAAAGRRIAANKLAAVLEQTALTIAIHELAHALLVDNAAPAPLPSEAAAYWKQVPTWFRVAPEGGRLPHPTLDNYVSHAAHGFGRAALHLAHRAKAAGQEMLVPMLFSNNSCFVPFKDLSAALGDEPARMRGEPIAQIMKEPAPATFAALATAEIDSYLALLKDGKGAVEAEHHNAQRPLSKEN